MGIRDRWQYDLAATLCLMGCIALPDNVFERAYAGQDLSPDEEQMFRAHPETGARLLSKIPRLETVAAIIRGQQAPEKVPAAMEQPRLGAEMLHLALALDRRIYTGMNPRSAVVELRMSCRFDNRMLDALENYSPTEAEFEVRRLPIRELRSSMVLLQDVMSDDRKVLILKEGTALTDTWIERLENFAKYRTMKELVEVRVPTLTGAGTITKNDEDRL